MAELRTTIVVLDRHEIVRKGLRTLFHSQPGLQVIGECATAREAIAQVTRFLPDVLVMSPGLPDASGFDTCRQLRAQAPSVRVVMLVASADERAVVAGVRAGATGVVSRRAPLTEICRAVRAAAAGTSLLDAPATAALLEHVRSRGTEADGSEALTDLERRVLALVVEGLTNREIAQALAISEKTTKGHLSRAFAKLHVTRRSQAAVLFVSEEGGVRRGGVRPEAA
jgi:DNA-binding NarL/FixJ family response regulator